VREDGRVGFALEAVAVLLELSAQVVVVVELAVVDGDDARVAAPDRLVPFLHVDDREPHDSELHVVGEVFAGLVRAPMLDRPDHPPQDGRIGQRMRTAPQDACETTHERLDSSNRSDLESASHRECPIGRRSDRSVPPSRPVTGADGAGDAAACVEIPAHGNHDGRRH